MRRRLTAIAVPVLALGALALPALDALGLPGDGAEKQPARPSAVQERAPRNEADLGWLETLGP